MRMNWMLTTAVVAMSVSAGAGGQSAAAAGTRSKDDTMTVTYTGCVEPVNHGGTFLLTRIEASKPMRGDMATTHDDDMATTHHDDMAMKHGEMASKAIVLAGSANLKKHVGQKVSVTGSVSDGAMGTMRQDVATLTIKTLKVIAKSCS